MRKLMAIIGVVLALAPVAAHAAEFDTPKALLQDIYKDIGKDDEKGYDAYFSDSLMVLMNANDARVAKGEDDALDFDPLISGQDPGGMKFSVGEPVIKDSHATADVTITEPAMVVLHFDLTKQANGWRVDDIHVDGDSEGEGWRLSELLATDPLMN